MHLIKKFKSALLQYAAKSETKKRNIVRKPKNIQECENILILFFANNTDEENKILLLAQNLRQQGKKVLLMSESSKNTDEEKAFFSIIPSDLNWYGKPKQEGRIEKLIKKDWDCILALYPHKMDTLEYILSSSNAATKAGFYNQNLDNLDIMIDLGKKDFNFAVNELMNILNTIKIRSYEPAI